MDDRPYIVVVEDEATQRDLLVTYLSRNGYRVNGVEGGPALRRLVDRELPNLIMLDVGLPGEDGFALARWLREHRSEEHTSELQSRVDISYAVFCLKKK